MFQLHFCTISPDKWVNGLPTGEHKGEIRNLQTDINESHREKELIIVEKNFTYVDKWISYET